MKFKIVLLFLFATSIALAQREANNWYFGHNAGIKFNNDNSLSVLLDGQLNTAEGCASISDNNGQLLFYTDGVTVYNKNHQIMVNGTGLMGHYSSTQSAIIVPKPGSTTLYYIFTVDVVIGNNGLRYSVVDMSLDGGLGAVTSDKNVLIQSGVTEKFCITQKNDSSGYWIVANLSNTDSSNRFLSYSFTAAGINSVPVESPSNLWAWIYSVGAMKISPKGDKLAMCVQGMSAQLFDFNNVTGVVSNGIELDDDNQFYGIEFSPEGEVLYVSDSSLNVVYQFDLNATNIPASKFNLVLDFQNTMVPVGLLQLGPDGKIYIAQYLRGSLGVIHHPNLLGAAAGIQPDAVDLQGRICELGLPSYDQTIFFRLKIDSDDVACVGDAFSFDSNLNHTSSSISWDFGDGSPVSNAVNPSHQYASPGTYTVSLSVNNGKWTASKVIRVYEIPTINPVVSLKQCDDNTDGFSAFNLAEANALVSSNYLNETFSYFETAADAQNNVNPITNFTSYTNQVVSNDAVYVKATNANGCFRVAQLNLNVSTTQIPPNFTRNFTVCDDAVQGTTTDGISSFDFSSVTGQIQGIFSVGQQLIITYYRNPVDALAEQNAITDTANYRNIGYPNTQNIYIRVDSAVNNDCLGLGQHITLNVERIPIVQPQVLQSCDDNQDGQFGFDTTNLQSNLLNGLTNVTVAYFDQHNNPLPSPLPNPYTTTSQTIRAVVTNTTSTACNYSTTIQFIVDDLPEAFVIPTSLITVCDDELNPASQDGRYGFDTSSFQNTLLGSQTGMTVNYFDQHNTPLPSPLPNPFVTGTQNVRVEVVNPANTSCKAIYTIPFVVHPLPVINLNGNEIVCNELTITKTLDAAILDGSPITDYTYVWSKDGAVLPSETGYYLNVNQEGTYTVVVTNTQGCSRTRTITVVASDLATITNVQVRDLSDNNTIVVTVSGNGNYVYSLDNVNFQTSNSFDHVPAGVYTLYVQDLNGCGTATMEISVLGIPNYFTPNGDGYHDYWNMEGLGQRTNAKIRIFDRFGKLIKQISPQSEGWDGTYAGNALPSTDYWYSIELTDGRVLKGHFTLKR